MVISQFPAAFGKYILLDRVNAGGMAEVFRAKVTGAESFERLVAIKCMLPALLRDEHFITMFIDEAKLASQLNHANVVQIYELGRLGERLYIAMELIHGRDLRHVLKTARTAERPLPPGFAAYVMCKVAAGLDFAHRKVGVDGRPLQLVHRDVSPQNILVSFDGEVKVTDFGIARAEARSTETQAGILKGKFAYMAPEQVIGAASDHRADIFAMGSVLFEVATGQRLFVGENDLAVLEQVRDVRLPDLAQALPPESAALAPILYRALARSPRERYAHASEMGEDLEQLLIDDRGIFGYKRAQEFMQALYADEVAESATMLRAYANVRREDCVVAFGDPAAAAEAEPGFVIDAAAARGGPATPAARRSAATKIVTLADVATVDAPQTGMHTRAVSRRPRPDGGGGAEPVDGATSVDGASLATGAPEVTAGAKVMRRLQAGAMLASLTAALLVIGLFATQAMRSGGGAHAPGQPAPASPPQLFQSHPAPPAEGGDPAAAGETDEEVDALGRPRFGWVQIRSISAARAHAYLDDKDLGPLPVSPRRVRVGEHTVKIVEDEGGRVRQPPAAITVSPRHSRRTPKQVAF